MKISGPKASDKWFMLIELGMVARLGNDGDYLKVASCISRARFARCPTLVVQRIVARRFG
jgi:hypothetical protein